MRLAKDDDVIEAFSANGPDQSFGKSVLPRRPGAIGLSRMPWRVIACRTTEPKTRS